MPCQPGITGLTARPENTIEPTSHVFDPADPRRSGRVDVQRGRSAAGAGGADEEDGRWASAFDQLSAISLEWRSAGLAGRWPGRRARAGGEPQGGVMTGGMVDVLVVGAGPTGLALAAELAAFGVRALYRFKIRRATLTCGFMEQFTRPGGTR
jgi:FAD binding domain